MLIFALTGLSVGSFLNLCIDRLPLGQSVVGPPSHCPVCQRRLSAFDLVPFFNYLWLRGRCRYCRAAIPIRLPLVELITGLAFAFLYWHFGLSGELGMTIAYACFLIVIFFVDLEHQLILNKVVYPGIVMAFIFSFLWPDLGVVDSLIGGAVGCAILLVPYLIYPKGIGFGDIKLALMVGLMTGYPNAVVAMVLAIFAGGLAGIILLAVRLKGLKGGVPFGTFLAVAAMATLFWGDTIREWYVDRFWG